MNIKDYLVKLRIMKSGESFIEYTGIDHESKDRFAFSFMTLDILDLREHSDVIASILKDRWSRTDSVLAVSTNEKRSSGFGKLLQNSLSEFATPAGPGYYLFFKDKELAEIYQFYMQTQGNRPTNEDLLVYLALARIKNENILSSLPEVMKDLIKKKLGNNIRAVAESRKLIAAIGKPGIIREMCENSDQGFQDDTAMWIHTSLIRDLDPALRVYLGCSSLFFGDPSVADIIKIHKNSAKVTYYLYDDFDNKHLPEMQDRIKVDLSRQKADHFDHRKQGSPEVVYFKERFVSPEDSRYGMWKDFSRHLESQGISPRGIHIERNKMLTEVLNSFCA